MTFKAPLSLSQSLLISFFLCFSLSLPLCVAFCVYVCLSLSLHVECTQIRNKIGAYSVKCNQNTKRYYVPTCLMANIGSPVVGSKQDNNFPGHKSLNTKWPPLGFCRHRKEPPRPRLTFENAITIRRALQSVTAPVCIILGHFPFTYVLRLSCGCFMSIEWKCSVIIPENKIDFNFKFVSFDSGTLNYYFIQSHYDSLHRRWEEEVIVVLINIYCTERAWQCILIKSDKI